MVKTSLKAALVSLAVLAAGPAAANGFYYGAGLGYSHVKSGTSSFGPQASKADLGILGVTLGYRFDRPTMFFSGELDTDFRLGGDFKDKDSGNTCDAGASGPYYCSKNTTVRLRGLVGTQVRGGYEVFGSAGVVEVFGTSATSSFTHANVRSTGFTLGLGVQRKLAGTGIGRVELIYDKADSSNNPGGYKPQYNAVTLKATWLF